MVNVMAPALTLTFIYRMASSRETFYIDFGLEYTARKVHGNRELE
jgi:hypothetical protein